MASTPLGNEIDRLKAEIKSLREVAKEVVDRWDTPNWKDAEATSVVVGRLRSKLREITE